MLVKELIDILQEMPQEKPIVCQVVGQESGAWQMGFELNNINDSWMVQLKVEHPALKNLPMNWE